MMFERVHLPMQLKLNNLLLQYRKMPHITTGQFPSMLLMKQEIRSRFDDLLPNANHERIPANLINKILILK